MLKLFRSLRNEALNQEMKLRPRKSMVDFYLFEKQPSTSFQGQFCWPELGSLGHTILEVSNLNLQLNTKAFLSLGSKPWARRICPPSQGEKSCDFQLLGKKKSHPQ